MKKILFSMLVVLLMVALVFPAAALADDQKVDNDIASAGLQHIATLTVTAGDTVNTQAQIIIEKQGGNHLSPGDPVEFVVIPAGDPEGTNLPAGYSVSNVTGNMPSTWDTDPNGTIYVVGNSTVTFTAPSTAGSYAYHMKWNDTHDYGNKLTGATNFLINLTVEGGAGPQETADVVFDQTGIGTDFTGTVVTIDGTDYGVGDLPVTVTKDVGLNISFAYSSPLGVDAGKQYVWTNTTGGLTADQSGNITVPSGGGNVIGNYKTQYYLTLDSNPAGIGTQTGAGWYDADTSANITTTSPVVNSTYTYFFAGWTTGDQGEIAEQYALNTTVLMDKAKTVTANYQAMTAGTGGKTLGFWSNKNGQAYISSSDLTMLSGLNLKNKNGSDFNPTTYAQLKTWLLNADAVYMRYMLSAQLAATELSVYNGLLSGSQLVWVDDGDAIFEPGEAQSINSIMTAANNELGTPTTRAHQEYLKNLLDKINNNLLWFVV